MLFLDYSNSILEMYARNTTGRESTSRLSKSETAHCGVYG